MINPHTKFEVSMFTHYEDLKATEIEVVWWVRGHPRSPAMPAFDGVHTTLYSTLIEICIYLVLFSSYSELFVKSRLFSPAPAFGSPVGTQYWLVMNTHTHNIGIHHTSIASRSKKTTVYPLC